MSAILVTHPGRQHSHQLATALSERGLLLGYWAGVPVSSSPPAFVSARVWRRLIKYEPLDLPSHLVRQWPIAPLLRHTIGSVVSASWAARIAHAADGLFDRLAARALRREVGEAPRLAVCYENAARETFREAKRLGAITVLDAASVHHSLQDQLSPYPESPATHARIVRRKDEEIALADHIITVSEAARASYVAAGVHPSKVVAIPLGADLAMFSCGDLPNDGEDGVFHFVYAGNACEVKGTDILLAAMERLRAAGVPCRLTIAGARARGFHVQSHPNVQWVGRLSHGELACLYCSANSFVLPSRFDSFGMVVIEALACGLAVIVSDRVGASEAVRHGNCGWIVPADDVEALSARMQWCVERRATLRLMRRRARETAEQYGWPVYRNAVASHLARIAGLGESIAPSGTERPQGRVGNCGGVQTVGRFR